MKYYAQVVSDALKADPPAVRGLIDGQTIRRLVAVSGVSRQRVFTFDIIGNVSFGDLVRRKHEVALETPEDVTWLAIPLLAKNASLCCPSCGLEMLSDEFWTHYNTFHARRKWWLDEEDWAPMKMPGSYTPPPEHR